MTTTERVVAAMHGLDLTRQERLARYAKVLYGMRLQGGGSEEAKYLDELFQIELKRGGMSPEKQDEFLTMLERAVF